MKSILRLFSKKNNRNENGFNKEILKKQGFTVVENIELSIWCKNCKTVQHVSPFAFKYDGYFDEHICVCPSCGNLFESKTDGILTTISKTV